MTDPIHCGVCYLKYDRQERTPVAFPQCGHTCCKRCTNRVLAAHQPAACPFCKKTFIMFMDGAYLPPSPNFPVLNILEDKHLFGVCELHNASYEYLCEDDQQYACSKCCIFGKHQGHRIIELEVAKNKYDSQLLILENEKKELRGHVDQVQTLLNKRECNALKETDDYFDGIEAMIKKQRQERKSIIIQKFADEKKFFNSSMYTGDVIERDIVKYKAVTPENLCKIKHENFLEILKKSDQIANNIQVYINALNKILEKVTPSVLDNHSLTLPEIHFPGKIFPTQPLEMPLTCTEVQSCLSFEVDEDNLIIKLARTGKKLDFRCFTEDFKNIHLQVENVYISSEDCKFLEKLFSNLSQIQSISIEFGPEIVRSTEILVTFRKELANLIKVFFVKPNQILSLRLIWSSNCEGHIVVDILVNQVLSTLRRLGNLEINMPNMKFDNPIFEKLEMTRNPFTFSSEGIKSLLERAGFKFVPR